MGVAGQILPSRKWFIFAAMVHMCTHIKAKQRTVTGKPDRYDWEKNITQQYGRTGKPKGRVTENSMLLALDLADH